MDQVIDWLNENELRGYPLLENSDRSLTSGTDTWLLPDDFIIDLQLIVSYKLADDVVVLKKLTHTVSGDIVVRFGTATQDIEDFTLTTPLTQEFPKYIRNESGSLLVLGDGVKKFIDRFALETEILTSIPVEPTTCLEFFGPWLGVSKIYTQPEKRTESNTYHPQLPLEAVTSQSSMVGDLQLRSGYNTQVTVSDNAINLTLGADYGLKSTCRTSFISEEYLDCSELVSYINGIPPDEYGNFKLTSGANINIVAGNSVSDFNDLFSENSNNNTLFVGFSFQDADLCNTVNLTPSLL